MCVLLVLKRLKCYNVFILLNKGIDLELLMVLYYSHPSIEIPHETCDIYIQKLELAEEKPIQQWFTDMQNLKIVFSVKNI